MSAVWYRPHHAVALWLGAAKAGVATALVNVQTKGSPLVHAIRAALDGCNTPVLVVHHSLTRSVQCPEVGAALSPKAGLLTSAAIIIRQGSVPLDVIYVMRLTHIRVQSVLSG